MTIIDLARILDAARLAGMRGPPCGFTNLAIIGNAGCLFHKQTMIRLPIE